MKTRFLPFLLAFFSFARVATPQTITGEITSPGSQIQMDNPVVFKNSGDATAFLATIGAQSALTFTSPLVNTSGTISLGAVSLFTGVTGNLGVSHLNSGTSASSTTFWRGDGTWAVPFVFSTGLTDTGGTVTVNAINLAGTGSGGVTGVLPVTNLAGEGTTWSVDPSTGFFTFCNGNALFYGSDGSFITEGEVRNSTSTYTLDPSGYAYFANGAFLVWTDGSFASAPVMVASLPNPPIQGPGTMAFVSDATADVRHSPVIGGGTLTLPVYFDGTTWLEF